MMSDLCSMIWRGEDHFQSHWKHGVRERRKGPTARDRLFTIWQHSQYLIINKRRPTACFWFYNSAKFPHHWTYIEHVHCIPVQILSIFIYFLFFNYLLYVVLPWTKEFQINRYFKKLNVFQFKTMPCASLSQAQSQAYVLWLHENA